MLQEYIKNMGFFGEMRVQYDRINAITITNGIVTDYSSQTNSGSYFRMLKDNYWLMKYTHKTDNLSLQKLVNHAIHEAKYLSSPMRSGKINISLDEAATHEIVIPSKCVVNKAYLSEIVYCFNDYISKNFVDLDQYQLSIWINQKEKNLAVTTGSTLHSSIPESTLYVKLSIGEEELEESFYEQNDPSFFLKRYESICHSISMLYEHLKNKKNAIAIDDSYVPCVLAPKMTSKVVHEAVGHQLEADFALDTYPDSALLHVSSAISTLNVVDYAHTSFGQSCPYPIYIDDEGVTARDSYLIKDGRFCSYMTNRETAALLNASLTGNARAASYQHEPLIRMRNTALLPSESLANEMISSIEDGYYLVDGSDGNGDINGEFAYQVSIAYRIKNGIICESIKDCMVWERSLDFLNSISMIGNDFKWYVSECTKLQRVTLSSGAPTIKANLYIGGIP